MFSRIPQRRVRSLSSLSPPNPLRQDAPGTSDARRPVATSIAARTTGMDRRDGFLPIYLDARQGRILLELPRDSTRALLLITQAPGSVRIPSGSIAAPSGADLRRPVRPRRRPRAASSSRIGPTAASSGDPDHARTVAEAFPPSTVASLPLLADENGRLLVDATEFAMRDWNDVAGTLAAKPTRHVRRRPGPVEHLSAVHQGVPGEHARSTSR